MGCSHSAEPNSATIGNKTCRTTPRKYRSGTQPGLRPQPSTVVSPNRLSPQTSCRACRGGRSVDADSAAASAETSDVLSDFSHGDGFLTREPPQCDTKALWRHMCVHALVTHGINADPDQFAARPPPSDELRMSCTIVAAWLTGPDAPETPPSLLLCNVPNDEGAEATEETPLPGFVCAIDAPPSMDGEFATFATHSRSSALGAPGEMASPPAFTPLSRSS
mmetsp:Transcript_47417/g.146290  ORF Transcript_47417/g.146290 Transcript_47417/m.146290 type:complete len:221 (-) Transcript_47417:742-1404(-)